MARRTDARHVLYLNLDGDAKTILLPGKLKSVLYGEIHQDTFTLGAYDADLIETE